MKAAPVLRALSDRLRHARFLMPSGQYYDAGMSGIFFRQLDLPMLDVNLGFILGLIWCRQPRS